jgi:hypothetical protein
MRRSEITLTIQHERYRYRLAGPDVLDRLERLNGRPVRAHYNPAAPEEGLYLFDPDTDQPLGEAKRKTAATGNQALQTEADREELGRQRAIHKAYRRRLEERAQQLRQEAEQMGLDTNALEALNDYRLLNKEQLASAESHALNSYLRQQDGPTDADAAEGEPAPVPLEEQTPHARNPEPQRREQRGLYDEEGSLRAL